MGRARGRRASAVLDKVFQIRIIFFSDRGGQGNRILHYFQNFSILYFYKVRYNMNILQTVGFPSLYRHFFDIGTCFIFKLAIT